MQLTEAMRAALSIMIHHGRVYAFGGFGGNEAYGDAVNLFAKRITIDCLIREGYAEPGEGFNSYRITAKGRERISSWAKRSAARGKAGGRDVQHLQVVL